LQSYDDLIFAVPKLKLIASVASFDQN